MRHTPRGRGYDEAVHYFHHMEDYWQSVFQNPNGDTDFWSQCAAVAKGVRPRDLWVANASYEGPAVDLVNGDPQCSVFGDGENHTFDLCPYGPPAEEGGACPPYPGFPGPEHKGCTYVDETFATHAVGTVTSHVMDPAHPLYMFWVSQRTAASGLLPRVPARCGRCGQAPHIVHSPLQVPQAFYEKFTFIPDWRRRRYHAVSGHDSQLAGSHGCHV